MRKVKILFLAYLYPPVAGKGLPGVQRTVKFIRHLEGSEHYVLTMDIDLYPEFFPTNNQEHLPISGETIVRTGSFDLFQLLLAVRNFFSRIQFFRKKSVPMEGSVTVCVAKNSFQGKERVSYLTMLKDAVSTFLTFPDYAHCWID